MPPKQKPTRLKTNSVGIPEKLPDIGALYVNSDIINAVSAELVNQPSLTTSEAAQNIIPSIVRKYQEVNPRLVIIQDQSIKNKIVRLYDQYKQYSRKQLKADTSRRFQDKLPRLFDIIFCQCQIYRQV